MTCCGTNIASQIFYIATYKNSFKSTCKCKCNLIGTFSDSRRSSTKFFLSWLTNVATEFSSLLQCWWYTNVNGCNTIKCWNVQTWMKLNTMHNISAQNIHYVSSNYAHCCCSNLETYYSNGFKTENVSRKWVQWVENWVSGSRKMVGHEQSRSSREQEWEFKETGR